MTNQLTTLEFKVKFTLLSEDLAYIKNPFWIRCNSAAVHTCRPSSFLLLSSWKGW